MRRLDVEDARAVSLGQDARPAGVNEQGRVPGRQEPDRRRRRWVRKRRPRQVEQLSRYLDFIRLDPAKAECRGILAAQSLKPQAVTLAESRGLRCVEVDLAVLRGEREPELTLFG